MHVGSCSDVEIGAFLDPGRLPGYCQLVMVGVSYSWISMVDRLEGLRLEIRRQVMKQCHGSGQI